MEVDLSTNNKSLNEKPNEEMNDDEDNLIANTFIDKKFENSKELTENVR
jgi:hypothetical protein